MPTVAPLQARYALIQCGRGRLGTLLASTLQAQHLPPSFARIDPLRGLANTIELPAVIERLLICVTPPANPYLAESPWSSLLNGLMQQVKNNDLTINKIVHISSTAVFADCKRGWCTSLDTLTAINARSAGLIAAEYCVQQIAHASCIVRLPGLIGPGYERYEPLSTSTEQLRHAVDIRAAAPVIAQWLCEDFTGHRVEILTDGKLYYQQQVHDADDPAMPADWLQRFHVYRPTRIASV